MFYFFSTILFIFCYWYICIISLIIILSFLCFNYYHIYLYFFINISFFIINLFIFKYVLFLCSRWFWCMLLFVRKWKSVLKKKKKEIKPVLKSCIFQCSGPGREDLRDGWHREQRGSSAGNHGGLWPLCERVDTAAKHALPALQTRLRGY